MILSALDYLVILGGAPPPAPGGEAPSNVDLVMSVYFRPAAVTLLQPAVAAARTLPRNQTDLVVSLPVLATARSGGVLHDMGHPSSLHRYDYY